MCSAQYPRRSEQRAVRRASVPQVQPVTSGEPIANLLDRQTGAFSSHPHVDRERVAERQLWARIHAPAVLGGDRLLVSADSDTGPDQLHDTEGPCPR